MKISVVGLGDMGQLYARIFANAGHHVSGIDLPHKAKEIRDNPLNQNFVVVDEPSETLSDAELVLFSVEAKNIKEVVKNAAPFIPNGCLVSGHTSIKTPEIEAFEEFLDLEKIQVATLHALHGPQVSPIGQTLIAINHNCTPDRFEQFLTLLSLTGSKIEILKDAAEHDQMMADIQVVTHIGFESVGTSFMHRGVFPWENPLHANGLDNIKLLLTLRIYSYKHHVYEGLAMLNPFSKKDVRAYAQAENELFGLMISQEEDTFRQLLSKARDKVFADFDGKLMLNDALMAEFSLHPGKDDLKNSHLSLLSMVYTWYLLGTNPYKNLVCQTPPFKLRVGMAEYLFLNDELLEESIDAALYNLAIRKDDLAFHTSVQEWAHIVESGDSIAYERHFNNTKSFLAGRLEEGRRLSNLLIERLNKASQLV